MDPIVPEDFVNILTSEDHLSNYSLFCRRFLRLLRLYWFPRRVSGSYNIPSRKLTYHNIFPPNSKRRKSSSTQKVPSTQGGESCADMWSFPGGYRSASLLQDSPPLKIPTKWRDTAAAPALMAPMAPMAPARLAAAGVAAPRRAAWEFWVTSAPESWRVRGVRAGQMVGAG